MRVRVCSGARVHVCSCVRVRMRVRVYACSCVRMCSRAHAFVYMCVRVHVSSCVCVYIRFDWRRVTNHASAITMLRAARQSIAYQVAMHVCTTHSVRQDRGVLGPQAECFGGGGGGGARRAKNV